MFAKAYKQASAFTHPVIISTRFFDGTVDCGCGTFVVINREGWIITVAHWWASYYEFQQHSKEIADYYSKVRGIEQDRRLNQRQKTRRISNLQHNPKWITNHSFWWGQDGVQLTDVEIFWEADLVIGRLEPFDAKSISKYPIFKNPETLEAGTSLCKLGYYPSHKIEATFDEEKNAFQLAPNATSLPRFPIEGIYTRNIRIGRSKDKKYDIEFLETSSPGLRGQSGGPVFDVKGTVWSIQSSNVHCPLGFGLNLDRDGQEVKEPQFLNVGWGVHPRLITAFLKDRGIKFESSNY